MASNQPPRPNYSWMQFYVLENDVRISEISKNFLKKIRKHMETAYKLDKKEQIKLFEEITAPETSKKRSKTEDS